MKKNNYYLGLDIGTDSVGYAVTDEKYNLIKFHGEPAWGATIFDAASQSSERRDFRSARRRLERKKQRIQFLREIFAEEIAKVDDKFYIRLDAARLYRNETGEAHTVFCDEDFTDKEYYVQYPTIHHLICELMNNPLPHDIRLVYLACAWLVKHRGHFLSNISMDNIAELNEFSEIYAHFVNFFSNMGYDAPWNCSDITELGNILRKKANITTKTKMLNELLFEGKKPSKDISEEFPFNRELLVKLLAGGSCKVADVFGNDNYEECGTFSLGMEEEKYAVLMTELGDDYELIDKMRAIFDWTLLQDIINDGESCISEAKVTIYKQHKKDLADLKYIIRKYRKDKYEILFRGTEKSYYASYVYHTDAQDVSEFKKSSLEDFSKMVLGIIKDIVVDEEDRTILQRIKSNLELRTFLPKQKTTDNRVIPHQLYLYELNQILANAESYLPFLKDKDEDGISVSDKIRSVFLFRIPYFVGPLNENSQYAWLERKAGKIYPWNFDKMVDLDRSEQNFIAKMTNACSYLPGEKVLPKDSLAYHKFSVLNEINNIQINGVRISVELKQQIYNELLMNVKKVSKKKLCDFLVCNNYLSSGDEGVVTGIDININSNLTSQIAFKKLLSSGALSESDAERIIERSTYAEDKERFKKWLNQEYSQLAEADKKYIAGLRFKDFGRLSRKFISEIEGIDKTTGEAYTILSALWSTQCNLMELLSERFTFKEAIAELQQEYYRGKKLSLEKRLDEMYISNAVKRPIYRTLDIVRDIKKAFGEPKKIFVEVARGTLDNQKGKRTKSRKEQILELYAQCKDEDVKILKEQLEQMGEYAENKLQGDKLFLYYMQLGKSMYSGTPIVLERLASKEYDIDHIYPQAYVKDDSILNNKVLVLSSENGKKSDNYPIASDVRNKMRGMWDYYKEHKLITEEKYKRLVRSTSFTEDEKLSFINRQIIETSQSTKAVATLLKEYLPNTEIVYSKARIVSEFRQEFDLYKSRIFNDLHHAVDAYLNIVTGNVYSMKFTKQWFNVNTRYSIKTSTIFTHPLICQGVTVWNGLEMLEKVKNIAKKNNAHFTKYSFYKKGGLFDQLPVKASNGLIPLKQGLDTSKYGGYNKPSVMFLIPTRYKAGKKTETIIMSVDLINGKRFLNDSEFAKEYSFTRLEKIIGKKIDLVEFPMGMRPWKINTVLSLDGFKICIAGISSGGRCLIAQPIMQFSESNDWKYYIKKLQMLVEKTDKNKKYIYSADYDKVTQEENVRLYELYIRKLSDSIYSKRVNNPVKILIDGKEKFEKLDIITQSRALLNIHQVFGRASGGCDLSLIGGASKAASTAGFSATVSNWRKIYNDVRLIDTSPSGLWQKESDINLLELL